MNKKENSGYQVTHKAIQDTLLRLMEREDFQKITVSRVCADCGVNRSTFYAHYTDLYEVMEHYYREIVQELVASYDTLWKSGASPQSQSAISAKYLEVMLAHVKSHATFYRVYMLRSGSKVLSESLRQLREHIVLPVFTSLDVPERYQEYYFGFFMDGMLSVVKKWLDYGCPEPPAEITQVLSNIFPEYTETVTRIMLSGKGRE